MQEVRIKIKIPASLGERLSCPHGITLPSLQKKKSNKYIM